MNEHHDHRSAAPFAARLSRRAALGRAAGTGVALAAVAHLSCSSVSASQPGAPTTQDTRSSGLTVVLVHGAFADGASWAGVIAALQTAGVEVLTPANPLRGLAADSAYIASVVTQIPGKVLLVGHSYGGAVISNVPSQVDNVVGLVYVAGFIPDEGETIQGLAEQATDSLLGPALRPAQYPTGDAAAPGTEFYVDPASFPAAFAADLPAERAAVLAASQRPASALAFGEPSGPVGWKSLPSWAVVSPNDLAIGPAGERLMAERAKAEIVEVDGSHLLMISHPQAVADVILTAVGAVA